MCCERGFVLFAFRCDDLKTITDLIDVHRFSLLANRNPFYHTSYIPRSHLNIKTADELYYNNKIPTSQTAKSPMKSAALPLHLFTFIPCTGFGPCKKIIIGIAFSFVTRFYMNKSFLFLYETSQNVSRVIEQTYVLHLLAVRVALGVEFGAGHGHLDGGYEALVARDQLLQLLLLNGGVGCVRRQHVQRLHQPLHLLSLAVHLSADTLVEIYWCQRNIGLSIYFKIRLNATMQEYILLSGCFQGFHPVFL